jgi:hypothetical protein
MIEKIDRKNVESKCSDALQELGFTTRRGVGTLNVDDDFYYWVGLNAGVHTGFVRVNPFVGVHSKNIMRITSEAKGEKYKPLEVATFAVFLGDLAPNTPQFIFHNEGDVSVEAGRLAVAIKELGIPFMKNICNYESLLPCLKRRVPMLGGYPQRYAAALYLNGDRAGAIDFVESYLADTANSEIDVLDGLKNLKARFLAG